MKVTVFVTVSKLFLQYVFWWCIISSKRGITQLCLLHWNIGLDQVRNENIQQGQKKFVPVIKKTRITKLFLSFLYYNYGDT